MIPVKVGQFILPPPHILPLRAGAKGPGETRWWKIRGLGRIVRPGVLQVLLKISCSSLTGAVCVCGGARIAIEKGEYFRIATEVWVCGGGGVRRAQIVSN